MLIYWRVNYPSSENSQKKSPNLTSIGHLRFSRGSIGKLHWNPVVPPVHRRFEQRHSTGGILSARLVESAKELGFRTFHEDSSRKNLESIIKDRGFRMVSATNMLRTYLLSNWDLTTESDWRLRCWARVLRRFIGSAAPPIEFPGEISTVPMICRRRPSVKAASKSPQFCWWKPYFTCWKRSVFWWG
jgi:hypothetical protein